MPVIILNSPRWIIFPFLPSIISEDIPVQRITLDGRFQGDSCNVFSKGFVNHGWMELAGLHHRLLVSIFHFFLEDTQRKRRLSSRFTSPSHRLYLGCKAFPSRHQPNSAILKNTSWEKQGSFFMYDDHIAVKVWMGLLQACHIGEPRLWCNNCARNSEEISVDEKKVTWGQKKYFNTAVYLCMKRHSLFITTKVTQRGQLLLPFSLIETEADCGFPKVLSRTLTEVEIQSQIRFPFQEPML